MANRICVIDVPGLSRDLLSSVPKDTALGQWLQGKTVRGLTPSFPAVTCSVQATLTTGAPPSRHGIVANGIATFRSQADQQRVDASNFADYRRQVSFWEQSNQFLQAPRFWQDSTGRSKWKTALLFFQNSMPGFSGTPKPAADIVLTPKPDHGPDGKLVSLCWSQPAELVPALFRQLGPFPLMNYWGPMAGIASSAWIASAAAIVWREHAPQLQWVYVPHLDYDLQRFGPTSPQAHKAVADAARALDPLLAAVGESGGKIILLSEYAMQSVNRAVQPNRMLAEAGLLVTRQTPDGKLIDYENSPAFAMTDHQVAYVYAKPDAVLRAAAALKVAGVAEILPSREVLEHERAGELVLKASPNAWFDYRWWSNPSDAPIFARTVDIHRKPGYDPLELFWDRAANGTVQDASLIHGSHGLAREGEAVLVSELSQTGNTVAAVDLAGMVERWLG